MGRRDLVLIVFS